MSFKSYTKWWIKTKAETEKLWQMDQAAIQKAKATKKRNIAFNLVSGIYARYATLVQEIDACLDQMCQVINTFLIFIKLYVFKYVSLKNE